MTACCAQVTNTRLYDNDTHKVSFLTNLQTDVGEVPYTIKIEK